MDLSKLTEISVWDVRNAYNKVKNVVMNYTEMEIKVNEATGPEPWGASSTLMREIADATFISKHFDEIMTAIYLRFSDTDPSNWRQAYKALQLIEYLVKSGSERVVDDVRGHITIIKMLKSFHHIDSNGKDQGINVRQRSRELVDLVQNSDRVRDERQRAKDNRNKYSGISNDAAMVGFGSGGISSGGGNKYSGFGSESIGRSGGKYAGFGSDSYAPSSSRYDNSSESPSNPTSGSASRAASSPAAPSVPSLRKPTRHGTPAVTASKPATPAVADLFSFDDDENGAGTDMAIAPLSALTLSTGSSSTVFSSIVPPPTLSSTKADRTDDDWGDFQSSGLSPGAGVGAVGGSDSSFAAVSQQLPFKQSPASRSGAAISPAPAMDLLGGDEFASSFQPLSASSSAAAATATTQKLPANKHAFGAMNSSGATPAQKDAFSDIWDMSSGLLSLDSLTLADKNKSSGASNSSRPGQRTQQQMPMNQQLSGHQNGSFS
ncbi:Epsin-3, clathrin recruitment and traffic between the Golgi and endosome [Coemansia sp. RSA 2320]|nr:Epsin-3, clathrin recruitment and traffic between the Golgi and endosome [Coemansia sp. RSA 2320]